MFEHAYVRNFSGFPDYNWEIKHKKASLES